MINCLHNNIIGDKYGQSCKDCGERIAGYGYNAKHNDCIHKWTRNYDYDNLWMCVYCELEKTIITTMPGLDYGGIETTPDD